MISCLSLSANISEICQLLTKTLPLTYNNILFQYYNLAIQLHNKININIYRPGHDKIKPMGTPAFLLQIWVSKFGYWQHLQVQ